MRLECGVGFCQLRTCRRIRPGRLCAKERHRVHLRRPTTPSEARQCRPAKRNRDQQPELRLVDQQSDQATAEQRRPGTVLSADRVDENRPTACSKTMLGKQEVDELSIIRRFDELRSAQGPMLKGSDSAIALKLNSKLQLPVTF
jgi:hypothetical protein